MKNKEELKKKTGVKKFDICLMNPPYDRGLHLKFLEKVIECTDNVISIQPVNWLEDIGCQLNEKSQYYKYENSISKHIYNLDKIEGNDATRIFGGEGNVSISQKLAIYHCNKNGGYEYSLLNDVFPYKLYKKTELPFEIGEYKDHKNDNIVPISNINGCVKRGYPSLLITTKYGAFNKGKNENNKTFEQLKHENPRFTFGNIDKTRVIIFDTYNEAQNFYDMCQTMFWKVICYKSTSGSHIPINVLPWPNNYKEKWTDEKLIKYFNLSDKDINEYKKIEKEITDILNSFKK